MISSDRRGEQFEPVAGDRHKVGDAGKIPVGIGDLGMTDVGRERRHGVVDIGAVLMPELDTAADEGVTQIMDAYLVMAAARDPTKLGAQLLEDSVYRSPCD